VVAEEEIPFYSFTNWFFCAFTEFCCQRSLLCFLALANLTVVNQIVGPDVYFL